MSPQNTATSNHDGNSSILGGLFSGFRNLFGSGHPSKDNAKSRLQFVLVQDRAGMSAEEMGKFKAELMGVIEKYFRVEKDKFDITYKREAESTTLLINSPVALKRNADSKKKAANA